MATSDQAVRIVHLTTVPQTLSFLHGQVGYMKDRGFEVHAISSPGDRLGQFGQDESIQVHAVSMTRAITPLLDLVALLRLYRLFRSLRPSIVHAHSPKAVLLGLLAAALARVPVRVCHLHGIGYGEGAGLRGVILRHTGRLSCRFAHAAICVSDSSRDFALREGIADPAKMKVLGHGSANGVDAEGKFNPSLIAAADVAVAREIHGVPADALVVGFVGRVAKDKGVEELAAAWVSIRNEFPEAHLMIVGPAEAHDPISATAETALRSDERVHLTGEDRNVAPLYASMSLLALPSYREGLPTVALEAAAMGLPVIATRIMGCVDAVEDGVTGTLVPPRDPRALADAMRTYLLDPHLRREHGAGGRERMLRCFRPQMVWEAVYREYALLLTAKGLRVPVRTHE